jgi:hypothetical protein
MLKNHICVVKSAACAVMAVLCLAAVGAAAENGPAVLYYSRTGTTTTVAAAIADHLDCPAIAVQSRKKRTGFWTITCVLDQLLDRDDETAAPEQDLPPAQPLIIAVPIWIHRPASPMRSYLASQAFQGSDAILVLTHQGNFSEKDIASAREFLQSCGLRVAAIYDVCTRGLGSPELRGRAKNLAVRLEDSLLKSGYTLPAKCRDAARNTPQTMETDPLIR